MTNNQSITITVEYEMLQDALTYLERLAIALGHKPLHVLVNRFDEIIEREIDR